MFCTCSSAGQHEKSGEILFSHVQKYTVTHRQQLVGTHLMVLSEDPLTTSRSLYWRHAMPRLCPFRVRTNSHVLVLHTCETQGKHSSENYTQRRFLNLNRSRYEFINSRGLRLTFAGQWDWKRAECFYRQRVGVWHEWKTGATGPSSDKSHRHCYCTSSEWENLAEGYI